MIKRTLLILVLMLVLTLLVGLGFWRRLWLEEKFLEPYSQLPKAYELVGLLEKDGFFVSSPPQIMGNTIQASFSGVIVLFSAEKDLSSQVRSLQLVLPKSKMGAKQAKEIDLRFSKVVIRY